MDRGNAFLIIGNPENRRVTLFQDALLQAGLPPAVVVSYLSLLKNEVSLQEKIKAGTKIRIESPGENFEVEKKILALGGVEHAEQLEDERGRIYFPGSWFLGFSRLMNLIEKDAGDASWFNHPSDIVTMFNKPLCKTLLRPHTLAPYPTFLCYEDFFAFLEQQSCSRFFIKLNYSSSASGIVAYEYNKKTSKEQAYSTVEVVGAKGEEKYYNSLKIRKYTENKKIRTILDFIFKQGAFVERWIPKAKHEDSSFDLRVVSIAQKRCHSIARLSQSPMTNLHLGNRRCDTAALDLSQMQWQKIDMLVEQSMSHFPRSLYAGLDILIPRADIDPILLEVNAFGDLLPNLQHNGKGTYLAEIEASHHRQECVFANDD